MITLIKAKASSWSLMDHPMGHRRHVTPTPLVGGIAIFISVLMGSFWIAIDWDVKQGLWYSGAAIVIMGICDDVKELSSGLRFIGQAVAIGLTAWIVDVSLENLGAIFDGETVVYLGRWGIALTIFAAVGVINAVNMSDGMDGLAGSLVLVTCISLILLAWLKGQFNYAPLIGLVSVSILGFLLFNLCYGPYRVARVYLGDAGSMFLGFMLAWFLIAMSQGEDKAFTPVTALWVFALPLFDAVATLARRMVRRKSPFGADRNHYHHYLLLLGLSVNQVLILSVFVSICFSAIGISGYYLQIPQHIMFYGFLGVFMIYLIAMEGIYFYLRRINSGHSFSWNLE